MLIKTDKSYRSFLTATTVSAIGSFAFNFAFMSFLYFQTENDKRFVALSQVFFVIGMLLGNLSGGVWGEKFEKRTLLQITELIRVPIVLIMLLFSESIWVLLFLHGLKTYFAGISTPLKRAYINSTIASNKRSEANTGFTISYSITQIIGPFLGTWIYSIVSDLKVLIVIDAITFLISFALMLTIRKSSSETKMETKFFTDLKSAFNYLKGGHAHRGLFYRHTIVGFISGLLIPLVLPFCDEVLGEQEKFYGILMALFGIGGILGAIINQKYLKKINSGKKILYICLLEPIVLLSWIYTSNKYFNLIIFTLWGALFFARATSQFNYISLNIKPEFNSRVSSLFDFVFTATNIIAVTFISIYGHLFTVQLFLSFIGAIYLIGNILTPFLANQQELKNA